MDRPIAFSKLERRFRPWFRYRPCHERSRSHVTSLSIVNTLGVDHIWQTVLVQIGFQHPYVMHGIFSLAALNLAYLDPLKWRCLIATAAHHHNKALHDFKTGIGRINDENSDALFASATMNILYVFAVFGKLYDEDTSEPAATYRSYILYLGNWDDLDPDVASIPEDTQILSLKSIWVNTSDASIGLFIWLSLVPGAFFLRLQQRKPEALLMFAYFGGLAEALGRYWWMEGWRRNIVEVVRDMLGSYWERWMELPRRLVGLRDKE
ncbi:hypothetical protein K469DRAFT_791124 [Zopfia rhizophila CBS 207.26]|uniref:Uncharacterized protein n=1 Tax=Zopfia rhizophila CBS 207.26 TaxID=1314779 RepID=A0A6A6D5S9_9PEZI|nr:hypothetical protein K469DRAFT_791124 [Zopfia rhizophila CBS 207.26]